MVIILHKITQYAGSMIIIVVVNIIIITPSEQMKHITLNIATTNKHSGRGGMWCVIYRNKSLVQGKEDMYGGEGQGAMKGAGCG